MPYELECYVAIVALALIGLVKRPVLLLSLALALGTFSGVQMFTNEVAIALGVLQRNAFRDTRGWRPLVKRQRDGLTNTIAMCRRPEEIGMVA